MESSAKPPDQISPPAKVLSLVELLRLKSEDNQWIVKDLLRRGAQMVLAGPPKSGKSMIAGDLALTLARNFTANEERCLFGKQEKSDATSSPPNPFVVSRPEAGSDRGWRVLYFSLEMTEGEVAARLKKQVAGHGLPNEVEDDKSPPPELNIDLDTVFGVRRKADDGSVEMTQDIQLLTTVSEFGRLRPEVNKDAIATLQEVIAAKEPEVVIYDTLVQLHDVDENNNILMKALMRAIRRATMVKKEVSGETQMTSVAHIVLHHTRKDGMHPGGALSVDSLRGAGAVHASADLVMVIRPQFGRQRHRIDAHVSSRYSKIDDFVLEPLADQTFRWEKREPSKKDPLKKANAVATALAEFIETNKGAPFDLTDKVIAHLSRQATDHANVTVGQAHLNTSIREWVESGSVLCRLTDGGKDLKRYKTNKGFVEQLARFKFLVPNGEAGSAAPEGYRTLEEWLSAPDSHGLGLAPKPVIAADVPDPSRKKIKKRALKGKNKSEVSGHAPRKTSRFKSRPKAKSKTGKKTPAQSRQRKKRGI